MNKKHALPKNWRARSTAALMAAALAVTAAGCGKTNKGSKATGEDLVTTAEKNSNFNATGTQIVKKKTTYKVVVGQMSSVISADKKKCVQDAEKATNVHIEWTEIPTSSWTEKTNILFASNELPDAIIGTVDVSQYGAQLTPLNDLIDKYAPTVQKLFKERPDYPPALSDANGIIRGLPIGDESTHNIIDSQMWVNENWLKKLNLSVPKTTDEFKTMLEAFRDKDPNGNGQKDEIPFTFTSAWGWSSTIENIFGSFGAPESDNHVFLDPSDNKTVKFSPELDGYYKALQWLNGLYKEGLLDPGVFTQASDQYDTKNAGKDIIGAYMSYGTGSLGNSSIPSVSIPNLTGPDGKDMFIKNNVTRGVGFSIPRTNKTPEVLLRWYDYLNSSLENVMAWDRGEENLCWKWKDSSKDSVLSIYRTTEDWKKLGYDSESDARSRTSFAGWSPALYTQAIEKKFDSQTLYPSSDVKLAAVEADLKHGVSDLPTGTATASNASQRSLILTDMNNYLKKFISDSVINGIDDAKWKAHLQKLKDLKADTYKQLCQEYVDGVNKLKTSSSK